MGKNESVSRNNKVYIVQIDFQNYPVPLSKLPTSKFAKNWSIIQLINYETICETTKRIKYNHF